MAHLDDCGDNMLSVHAQWAGSLRPLDVLLNSSLKNMMAGETVTLMMWRYGEFRDMVHDI